MIRNDKLEHESIQTSDYQSITLSVMLDPYPAYAKRVAHSQWI